MKTKKTLNLEKILNKRICPGCGKENPQNSAPGKWFECKTCGWEDCDNNDIPTVKEIMKDDSYNDCDGVFLQAFLKTLLR